MMKKKLIFCKKIPLYVIYKTVKNSQEKEAVCILLEKEKKYNFIIKNLFFLE